MGNYLHALVLVICGILLLWFGYFLFFGPASPFYPSLPWSKNKKVRGTPGNPKVCPVCSITMLKGELIKTIVFPPASAGSIDRLMHIKGCDSCLDNGLYRRCPVCKASLTIDDFLVARRFERPLRKNHVHVLGCNRCRKA